VRGGRAGHARTLHFSTYLPIPEIGLGLVRAIERCSVVTAKEIAG
jgi:hypothetical protein